MLMFSLLNPSYNNNCRSAVLSLYNFDLTYLCTDNLTALSQQSESRLYSWDLSKLDPCKRAAKHFEGEITVGATERGLQYLALDITA